MIIDLNDKELHIIQAGLAKLLISNDFKQDVVKELYDKLTKAKIEDIKINKEENVMSKKMDILTTLSKGIYTDDNYNVVDEQVADMINEYYKRFKRDIEFQGRMSITILSLDNLDGDEGDKLRWEKIKKALPEVYNKDFVDFTLINCRNMQEIESSFVDHANFVYNTYNARTIVISRFKIFEDFFKSKDWINQAQFIVWYDTKEEWEKSRNRLSRPHFGDKSDKIEHKAALSQRWYFLLQENTWRDKNGNKHFVPNMPENYIKNCLLWLDETLCGKYIPDPELRKQFKSLFQNELSHRDTLNRISKVMTQDDILNGKRYQDLHSQMAIKCGIDVNDLPSMTKRTDSQKYIIEDILNQLKNFGAEEVIKHYQNKSALEKPYYYWEELEVVTSPINGSTKIPIKVRMMLNIIAHNNCKKIYEYKVGKESGRWSASKPQFLSKEEHNDFHTFDKKENDIVNRPAHYANRKYEPINVISDWKLDFLLGNTVKYISRLGLKDDPKQDINKALFYLIYKCKKLGLTQEEIEKTVKQIFSM